MFSQLPLCLVLMDYGLVRQTTVLSMIWQILNGIVYHIQSMYAWVLMEYISTVTHRYLSAQHTHTDTHTHRHTHTHPFNGPLSRTTRVGRYQKGKTKLDFTEARDSEWQWRQLGHMQVCTSLQADNHASTPPLSFLQAGCPSCRPTNSVKALKAYHFISRTPETLTITNECYWSFEVSRRLQINQYKDPESTIELNTFVSCFVCALTVLVGHQKQISLLLKYRTIAL